MAALFGTILSGLAILGITAPRPKDGRPFQWDMAVIGAVYLLGTWLLYELR